MAEKVADSRKSSLGQLFAELQVMAHGTPAGDLNKFEDAGVYTPRTYTGFMMQRNKSSTWITEGLVLSDAKVADIRTFQLNRMVSIAERHGMDPGAVLDESKKEVNMTSGSQASDEDLGVMDYGTPRTYTGLMMQPNKSSTWNTKGLWSDAKVAKILASKMVFPISKRGGNGEVAYRNTTERALQPDRIVPIVERYGMDPGAVLVNITTGIQASDELLGGGTETMAIAVAAGEFRAGKKPLANNLCISPQFPTSMRGGNGEVAYINTEGTFRPDWILPVAERRYGMDHRDALDNIIYARAGTNYEHQSNLLLGLAAKMSEEPFRLLMDNQESCVPQGTSRQTLDEVLGGGIATMAITVAAGQIRISRPDRILPVAERQYGMDHGAVLDNMQIIYARGDTYGHQSNLLLGLAAKMSEEPCRLLIADSVSNLYMVEFTDRGDSVATCSGIELPIPPHLTGNSVASSSCSCIPSDTLIQKCVPFFLHPRPSSRPFYTFDPPGDTPRDPTLPPPDSSSQTQTQTQTQTQNPLLHWCPPITRGRYILSVLACAFLIASTVLLYEFLNGAEKDSICFVFAEGYAKHCKAAIIFLHVSGVVLCIGGFLFLSLSHRIRLLPCVNPGNRFCSVILFVMALIISNLPSFINSENNTAFWCSSSYQVYFWLMETVLSVKTDTNLHSTFASINLTAAVYMILHEEHSFLIWMSPVLVLTIAAVLHFLSFASILTFHKPISPTEALPPPLTAADQLPDERTLIYWFRVVFYHVGWLLGVPLYHYYEPVDAAAANAAAPNAAAANAAAPDAAAAVVDPAPLTWEQWFNHSWGPPAPSASTHGEDNV